AADHEGDLDALRRHLGEAGLQLGALGRAGGVAPGRLVERRRRPEDAGSAHPGDCSGGALVYSRGVRVTRELYAVEGWGVGEIVHGDGVVLAHELPGQVRGAPDDARAASAPARASGEDVAAVLAERVRRHLAGVETDYRDVPLDLSWCTPFQRELAEALREVPWG